MTDPGQQPDKESGPGSVPLPAGTTISGRYRVESLLGEGGMGSVYLVEHLGLQKRMALKILRPSMLTTPSALERFRREAVAAAHLEHPHVAAALDYGQSTEGHWFLALEYVEGHDLRHELKRIEGPFPPARAVGIARQIVNALVRSHELGLVHRDLKPENIMLVRRNGQEDFVKILDFGLALATGPLAQKTEVASETERDAPGLKLTQLGEMIGTPAYMAPEQAFGGVTDIRSDLYSVGVLLYEMLAGARPFKGKATLVLVYQALTEAAPPMAVRMPGVNIPKDLEDLVLRLLAKSPEERFQTPAELLTALDGLITKHKLEWPPGGAKPPALPTATSWFLQNLGSYIVQSGRSVRARVQSAFGRVRALLPEPMRRLPLPLVLGVPTLVIVLLILRSLLSSETRTTASIQPAAGAPQAQAVMAPQPSLDAATVQGADALAALERQYPADARIKRALVSAYSSQRRHVEAVQAIAQLIPLDPACFQTEPVMNALLAAVQGPPEATEAAASLLEQLGEGGVDLLYDLTTKSGRTRGKTRLQQSLGKPEVIARASTATKYALELRGARSCEAKRALLPRASQEGDQRALALLKALTQQQGCGFMGDDDCWPCLRKNNALKDAIAALESRQP